VNKQGSIPPQRPGEKLGMGSLTLRPQPKSFNRVPSGPRVGASVAASSVVALGSLVAWSASPRGPLGTRLNEECS